MTVIAPGRSLADQAYDVLRDRLIMLDIAPGAPINEGRLCAELGIGRTPIRESLKRLETDHLVVSHARRGTFASQVDITDLADISEVRQVLEPLAARRAARLASADVRRRLSAKAAEVAAIGGGPEDKRGLMEHDLAIHRLIYRAAGNRHAEETLVRLGNLATRIWCVVLDRLPLVAENTQQHVPLIDAIVAGDGDRAAALAAEHVRHFEQMVRLVL